MTYHLMVLRPRSQKSLSIANTQWPPLLREGEEHRRARREQVRTWAHLELACRNVHAKWWVVEADSEAKAQRMVAELLGYDLPSLPAIPDTLKRRVLALGRW